MIKYFIEIVSTITIISCIAFIFMVIYEEFIDWLKQDTYYNYDDGWS